MTTAPAPCFEFPALVYLSTSPGQPDRELTGQSTQWIVEGAQKYPGAMVVTEPGGVFVVTLPTGRTNRYTPKRLPSGRHLRVVR
ncbi:hypothetical protein ACFZAM_32030 [Streptomyces sp. NPDC008079]|uniref:hypothetical protein n=1 Tax=Streptomyces sp. NPDC008079 TaxID=3364806 RepID=UPI0036F0C679